jgi:rod shape-determining protein MreD
MHQHYWQNGLTIAATFALGMLLAVYPLPMDWRWWRPEFVLLIAIYWLMVFPLTVSLLGLCLLGLFQDLLEATPFGQHGLTLLIVAYICILFYQRLRNFVLWQEVFWVFVLVALAQLPSCWVQSMAGRPLAGGLLFLAPACSSALVWPLLRSVLERLSRYCRIT